MRYKHPNTQYSSTRMDIVVKFKKQKRSKNTHQRRNRVFQTFVLRPQVLDTLTLRLHRGSGVLELLLQQLALVEVLFV